MTVYILGDSISKAVYLNASGRYSVNKDNYLQSILESLGHQVKNFSSFGATIQKGLTIFSRQQDSMEQGSYVLLEFGGNDCNLPWEKVAENPQGQFLANTPLQDFAHYYETLLDQLREKGFRPILMSLPPLAPNAFYSYLSRFLNGEALLHFLGKVDNIYFWQEDYDKSLRKLAQKKNLPLLDLRKILLAYTPYESLICEDGMHLSLKAQELLREKLYTPLKKLLETP